MKTGAYSLLRRMACLFAGDIAEELLREAAKQERRELRPNELTCYHESAHAILRICFGFDVAEIRLLDHHLVDGICLSRPWDASINLDALPSDQHQANQLVISLHVCGYLVCVPRLKRVVTRLVQKHWANVSTVAEMLLRKESKHVDKTEILAARGPFYCQVQNTEAELKAAARVIPDETRKGNCRG